MIAKYGHGKFRAFQPIAQGELGGISQNPYGAQNYLYTNRGVITRQDTLLQTQAGGGPREIELYSDLINDSVVFAALEKISSEILQRPFRIHYPENPKIERELEQVLQQLNSRSIDQRYGRATISHSSGFEVVLKTLIKAYITGIELCEIKWQKIADKIIPTAIAPRDNRQLQLLSFDNGTLEPRLITRSNQIDGNPLPPRTFVIHRHWGANTFDPYGAGIGKQIYWLVQFRRAQMANYMSFADRFTTPTAIAIYELGFPADEISKLQCIVDNIGFETGVVLPEGVKLEWLRADGEHEIYENIIKYLDTQISQVICGESTVGQDSEGGSRSRDVVADSLRLRKAKAISDAICETINSTLIKWFLELNYPKIINTKNANLPKFIIDFSDLDPMATPQGILNMVQQLKQNGYTVDAAWLAERINIPIKEEQAPDFNLQDEGVI